MNFEEELRRWLFVSFRLQNWESQSKKIQIIIIINEGKKKGDILFIIEHRDLLLTKSIINKNTREVFFRQVR